MGEKGFLFTEATKLYVDNMDVVLEAAISDISHFYKTLLTHLPNYLEDIGNERLCKSVSHSGKGYDGCELIHIWIGQNDKKDWENNIGYLMFANPIPNKVLSEWKVRSGFGVFDIVSANRIKAWIGYRGAPNTDVRERVLGLAHREDIGEYIRDEEDSFTLYIHLEAEDLIGSAARKIAAILKMIRSVQESKK
jgi:hypothetical protein